MSVPNAVSPSPSRSRKGRSRPRSWWGFVAFTLFCYAVASTVMFALLLSRTQLKRPDRQSLPYPTAEHAPESAGPRLPGFLGGGVLSALSRDGDPGDSVALRFQLDDLRRTTDAKIAALEAEKAALIAQAAPSSPDPSVPVVPVDPEPAVPVASADVPPGPSVSGPVASSPPVNEPSRPKPTVPFDPDAYHPDQADPQGSDLPKPVPVPKDRQ